MHKLLFQKVSFLLLLTSIVGCGQLTRGTGSGGLNEPVPDGQVVAQDSFDGVNGQEISGVAAVYLLTSGQYTIRIEGLSGLDESGLQVYADIDGSRTFIAALRSTKGSMNYTTSITGTRVFTSVRIVSPTTSPPTDYGIASFDG